MIDTVSNPPNRSTTQSAAPAPLTHAQESVHFLDQLTKGLPVYHMPQVFRLRGKVDVEALEKALRYLIERHEALRIRIQESPLGLRQLAGSAEDFKLRIHHQVHGA